MKGVITMKGERWMGKGLGVVVVGIIHLDRPVDPANVLYVLAG